jgi:hypothetical protein
MEPYGRVDFAWEAGNDLFDRSEHHPHPERSCIKTEGKSVWPVADLFTIGWKTYFWNPKVGRFDKILTAD